MIGMTVLSSIPSMMEVEIQYPVVLLGSLLAGSAVSWLAASFLSLREQSEKSLSPSWRYDSGRRQRVAQNSLAFRWFLPLIEELSQWLPSFMQGQMERVHRDLRAGSEPSPWTAEEFVATKAVEAILWGGLTTLLATFATGAVSALFLGGITVIGLFFRSIGRLRKRAARRRRAFLRALPFAVDLVAMTMEAGATFQESLKAVIEHGRASPVAREFAELLGDVEHGKPLTEALSHLQERIAEEEVREIVFAVHKANELGTPLCQAFLRLADQLRLRRSQWAEKAAGRANANIAFPGLVTMVACVVLIMAPFILQAIDQASHTF